MSSIDTTMAILLTPVMITIDMSFAQEASKVFGSGIRRVAHSKIWPLEFWSDADTRMCSYSCIIQNWARLLQRSVIAFEQVLAIRVSWYLRLAKSVRTSMHVLDHKAHGLVVENLSVFR